MPASGVRVRGARELRSTLRRAGYRMRDLGPAMRRVGSIVTPVAAAKAPKVTGRLAASIRPMAQQSRVRISSRLPYAGPIHWGWASRHITPTTFISDAATSTEPAWTELFWRELEDAVATVRGANP
nr:MAG TPA_asm: putative tail component [Caudoviricetes sp.]